MPSTTGLLGVGIADPDDPNGAKRGKPNTIPLNTGSQARLVHSEATTSQFLEWMVSQLTLAHPPSTWLTEQMSAGDGKRMVIMVLRWSTSQLASLWLSGGSRDATAIKKT